MSILTAAGGLSLLYMAFDEIREDADEALNDSTVRFQETRNLTNNLITDHTVEIPYTMTIFMHMTQAISTKIFKIIMKWILYKKVLKSVLYKCLPNI